MGLFTRYAMDALMKTSHPEVIRRQCWNLHPHRTPCTACKDICPYGDAIFTRPNLVKDWDPCTDCGLCVSACRSGCIVPSPSSFLVPAREPSVMWENISRRRHPLAGLREKHPQEHRRSHLHRLLLVGNAGLSGSEQEAGP